MILLFMLPVTLLLVLASSTSDDQTFCVTVTLFRPLTHQDLGRAGAAGNRLARDDKELGFQLGEIIPGERPCETVVT